MLKRGVNTVVTEPVLLLTHNYPFLTRFKYVKKIIAVNLMT